MTKIQCTKVRGSAEKGTIHTEDLEADSKQWTAAKGGGQEAMNERSGGKEVVA